MYVSIRDGLCVRSKRFYTCGSSHFCDPESRAVPSSAKRGRMTQGKNIHALYTSSSSFHSVFALLGSVLPEVTSCSFDLLSSIPLSCSAGLSQCPTGLSPPHEQYNQPKALLIHRNPVALPPLTFEDIRSLHLSSTSLQVSSKITNTNIHIWI
jgi:hypothetical protein